MVRDHRPGGSSAPDDGPAARVNHKAGWVALLLFVGCMALYHCNGRSHAGVDTMPPTYTAWALVRHGSLDLSPYPELDYLRGNHIVRARDGTWVSIRSPGSALACAPVMVPAALLSERVPRRVILDHLGKLAAAATVAGAVVLFFFLCRSLAPSAAWPATILFAAGTSLWSIASQALWTHGPATFWLCLALYLLLAPTEGPGKGRGFWAGLALGLAVLCRPTTALFGAASAVALLAKRRWGALAGLTVGGLLAVSGLLLLNGWLFGDLLRGGYLHDDWQTHPPLWLSLPGLLVAPSRGLFVFSPALLLMPWGLAALRLRSDRGVLIAAWSAAAALTVLFYARWHDWAGGWCYGPRFLCEIMPICCLLFALAYASFQRAGARAAAKGLIALSVAVHLVGIFGSNQAEAWFERHERDDGGLCLFELRDTQVEGWARGTVFALGERVQSLRTAFGGGSLGNGGAAVAPPRQGDAAVDGQGAAGDVIARRVGEEHHAAGDFLGPAEPLPR
jgi:hypothetical protein